MQVYSLIDQNIHACNGTHSDAHANESTVNVERSQGANASGNQKNAQPCPCSVALIGAGAMGSSIASALLDSQVIQPHNLAIADINASALDVFEQRGAHVYTNASDMLKSSYDCVIVAIKPQVLTQVISPLSSALAQKLVVSIAAGVSLDTLSKLLPQARLVRVMPNICVKSLSGACAVCPATSATHEDAALVHNMFSAFGCAYLMNEQQLDVAGVISGCGPAFFALMIDAVVRSGVEWGIPAHVCRDLALSTMQGTARQLLDEHVHPRQFMERVTSPAGTTAQGLRFMEGGLMDAVSCGVDAAMKKTYQLKEH